MSRKKKIFIIVLVIVFVLLAALPVYTFIYNQIPDYLKDRYIPKGYFATDGYTHAWMELDEMYYYKYRELPELNEEYTMINDDNVTIINAALEGFGTANIDDYGRVDFDGNNELDTMVSNGDYFIVNYFDKDGKEVNYQSENCKIYFYNTETNTLYYIYYVW